ncbi:MAG TPA: hypothetical protein VHO70_04720 [Chitinispirillaceae bacterium]|nr:hypothetical protein [Chitinispirillaceae bacterium]
MNNRTFVFPCRVWQGFFAFMAFVVVVTTAAPQVGYSIVKNGSSCRIKISGSSIGTIKSGEIICEYSTQLDIDEALVYSPLSAIVVGASVDRVNHRVKLVLNTTGKVSIDNTEMIVVDLKLNGLEKEPLFGLASAVFTDPQGTVKNAQILPVNVNLCKDITHSVYSKGNQVLKSYLLNGRSVPLENVEQLQKKMMRGNISLRLVSKR